MNIGVYTEDAHTVHGNISWSLSLRSETEC